MGKDRGDPQRLLSIQISNACLQEIYQRQGWQPRKSNCPASTRLAFYETQWQEDA